MTSPDGMTRAELRDHYAGIRQETRKDLRRLVSTTELVVAQWKAAMTQGRWRKASKWAYVVQMLEDKKMHMEVVLRTCRIKKKKRTP